MHGAGAALSAPPGTSTSPFPTPGCGFPVNRTGTILVLTLRVPAGSKRGWRRQVVIAPPTKAVTSYRPMRSAHF